MDQTEADRIRKLCHAAESNEKLFWKLVKSQHSSSQMSAFLVNGDLLTDKKAIRAMWADHFEALGTPSEIATFDKGFFTKVTDSVREVFRVLKLIMNIFDMPGHHYGNFCFSFIRTTLTIFPSATLF